MNAGQVRIISIFVGLIILGFIVPQEHKIAQPKNAVYTFHGDILPLLQANCKPCHFPGGKVYKKLPFDDSTTVSTLGKKLNTRLKKTEQQEIINEWVKNGINTKQ